MEEIINYNHRNVNNFKVIGGFSFLKMVFQAPMTDITVTSKRKRTQDTEVIGHTTSTKPRVYSALE